MADRGKLGHRISPGRRVERDAQHHGTALQHINTIAVGNIAEASRCACSRERPGQRAVTARSAQYPCRIGGIGIVAYATGIAPGQRIVVEKDDGVCCGSGRCITNRDGKRSGAGITIAIGDLIGKDIVDAARSAGIANIAVAAIGVERQCTISTGDRRSGRTKCAGRACTEPGEDRAVSTLRVRSCSSASSARTGQDITCFRTICATRYAIGVVTRRRRIIDDADRQIGSRGIAVAIGYDNGKDIRTVVTSSIIRQRIGVADAAGRNAGNGKAP